MDELSIQDLSDEDLQKIIAMGGIPEEQAALQKQLEQARLLQGTPLPEMRGNGRVQTAANPMETIGALIQQYAGMKKGRELESKADALRKQQMQGRQLFAGRMVDTPYRRSTQPFIQGVGDPAENVPMPGAMRF